ncbi:Protein FAM50 [Fasciolopsis buskii]|uniref:Protein FAM50 n=1 Tax=Fasciolopsis buskii TaxID=27845 RepID=A0A8E0VMJ5_9TREM|nr:Protein FAM50 [Fasciolopsis buski]
MATFKGAAKEAQRAALLMKQREKERQELELQKRKLEAEMRVGEMSTKFAVHYDAIEQQLRTDTIGLVTLDEMKARQQAFMTQREKELALGTKRGTYNKYGVGGTEKKSKLQPVLLSFADDEAENEDGDQPVDQRLKEPPAEAENIKSTGSESDPQESEPKTDELENGQTAAPKRRRLGKNPTVDTSFLPDIDRDEEEKRLR